jgi:hypothetical protein
MFSLRTNGISDLLSTSFCLHSLFHSLQQKNKHQACMTSASVDLVQQESNPKADLRNDLTAKKL